MELRDLGLDVLRGVEDALRRRMDDALKPRIGPAELPEIVLGRLAVLRDSAATVLPRLEGVGERDSVRFAQECLRSPQEVVETLARRDGSVICLRDGVLVPGPAAGDLRPDEMSDDGDLTATSVQDADFAPQLFRLRNLHCLMEELEGRTNPASPGFPIRGDVR